jgi:phosphoglycerate dehydrogenase-like enzyme
MKILVWLEHEIRAFQVQSEQLAALRARHPQHRFLPVHDEAELLRELPDAEAALVWSFAGAWYSRGPRLRFVATPAAGREKLEPDTSGRVRAVHGHFHGKIMAESLLGMMLLRSRRLDVCADDRRARRYDRQQFSTTRRLAGQSALIIGYGPLGRECARLLGAVGMRVVGVKRNANVDPAPAQAVHPIERLHALLPEFDHVVLTLPSDTGTEHLIAAAELALLRKSASLYNIGRGNAVDESSLVRALSEGKLAYAFLDVFEREPLPVDSPLWDVPNLALLPHASAIGSEYLDLWFEELSVELSSA